MQRRIPLLRVVETAASMTDRILVSFSGGKDSVVTLDLCMRHFQHVECFFMYYVKGLSFQEDILRYYEDRYGVPIYRIPHFELSIWLRYGVFREMDLDVPIVSIKQIYDYMRDNTDIYWIAAGERIADSVWRRAMIKHSGSIDDVRGRVYPISEWKKDDILSYIRQRKLRVGAESAHLGFSFRSLLPRDVREIRKVYPQDYSLIREWFPLVDAGLFHLEMMEGKVDGEAK